jgi:hypothetical protein
MGRVVFSIYATERLTGFGSESRTWGGLIEYSMFPELFAPMLVASPALPVCSGEVTWRGREHIQADIERFNGALHGVSPGEAFMTAVSPGQIYFNTVNDFYPDEEAFVMACAEAMANEYRAIVDAGFLLQIDAPDLAFGWALNSSPARALTITARTSRCTLKPSTWPFGAFRPDGSGCTSAGATVRGPTCGTSLSPRSSTSSTGLTPKA